MGKDKQAKDLVHRLTVKVEIETSESDLDENHFRVLIDTAVRQLLGVAAPPYTFGGYDERVLKGSILVAQKDLNLFWGALSLYGRHLDENIALHMNSIITNVLGFRYPYWNSDMEILSIIGLIPLAVTGLVAALCVVVFFSLPRRIKFTFTDKHAFVTGGSKGIGKAVAAELVRRGCGTVSIAARDEKALRTAAEELSRLSANVSVKWYQMDVTKSYEEIADVIRKAEGASGPIDLLVNNAGLVVQGGFDEIDPGSFESQMKINYLSAVYASRAVIGSMKARRNGHIALVSSAAGQCAIWGYTAYSPSKFALRGFAEALQMELLPHNIGVSVLFPPNTNTEGFEEELRSMPEETRQISGTAGIFSAEQVARETVNTIASGGAITAIGFEGWMLGTLTAGARSEPSFVQAVAQITLGGVLRGVMLIYLGMFNRIVSQCHLAKKVK